MARIREVIFLLGGKSIHCREFYVNNIVFDSHRLAKL